VLFLALGGSSFSQSTSMRNSIGLQLNPYFDIQLFQGNSIKPVYALRYTHDLNKRLSFGPEISGNFIKAFKDPNDLNGAGINLGIFIRYTLLPDSRIRPFVEFSPYYSFGHIKSSVIQSEGVIGVDSWNNLWTGYIGPGLTMVSKSQRITLDLFCKFTDTGFVNGKKIAFSYRLNFKF
jgi:hypothetical protein